MRIGQGQKTPKFLLLAGVGLKIKALHMRHFRGLDRDHLSRGCRGQILGERLDQKKPSIAALPRWHVPPSHDSLKLRRSLRNPENGALTLMATTLKGITRQRL